MNAEAEAMTAVAVDAGAVAAVDVNAEVVNAEAEAMTAVAVDAGSVAAVDVDAEDENAEDVVAEVADSRGEAIKFRSCLKIESIFLKICTILPFTSKHPPKKKTVFDFVLSTKKYKIYFVMGKGECNFSRFLFSFSFLSNNSYFHNQDTYAFLITYIRKARFKCRL